MIITNHFTIYEKTQKKESVQKSIQKQEYKDTESSLKVYSHSIRSIAFTGIKPSKELIEKGLQSGKTIEELCELYGMSKNALSKFIAEHNLTLKKQSSQQNSPEITKELLEQYIAEGKTLNEIAEIFNVSRSTILNKKTKFNIASPRKNSRNSYKTITADEINKMLKEGKTMGEIRIALGDIPKTSFQRILTRLQIETPQLKAFENAKNISKEEIETRLNAGMSVKQILEELGISNSQFNMKLHEFGLETPNMVRNRNTSILTQELLINERESGMSVAEIAKKYNVSEKAIYKRIHEFGIQLTQPKLTEFDKYKDFILKSIEEGKSHQQIQEELGINKDKYIYWLKKLQIKTETQIIKTQAQIITKEMLEEQLAQNKSMTDIAKEFGVSRSTIANRLTIFGLSTPVQNYMRNCKNITREDITNRLEQKMSYLDICKELNISESTYYRLRDKFQIESEYQKHLKNAQSITREQLLLITKSNKSVQEICKKLNIYSSTYYKKLDEFGIKTLNQLEKERIDAISKETLVRYIVQNTTPSEMCKELNLTPSKLNSLLEKYSLKLNSDTAKIDYKKASTEDLQNFMTDIFCEDEELLNNQELSNLTDFLISKHNFNDEETKNFIKLVQLIHGKHSKLINTKEILSSDSYKYFNKLKENAEKHFEDINFQINSIISYMSKSKDFDFILNLLCKYQPQNLNDKNIEHSERIIKYIISYIEKHPEFSEKESANLRKGLTFIDKEISSPNEEIFVEAKKLATDKNGRVNKIKVGEYIEKYNQFIDGDLEQYPDYFTEILLSKESNLSPKEAINYMIKLDNWLKLSNKEQSSLRIFSQMFNGDQQINMTFIKSYVENLYNNIDTQIQAKGKPGTVVESFSKECIFASNAKTEIYKAQKFPANIKMLQDFEDAMQYIVPPKGHIGIKQLTGNKKYAWEVKINTTDRLVSSDNTMYFDTYIPEGFHKRKKSTN